MENNFQTQTPKRNLPRDVFLHLLVVVTLYWSAISFVALLWQYINYFFPDALNRYYNYFSFTGPIRFAVASLIIVFPIFIFVSWHLNKIYAKESQVRESKIRKWLIYLTLFVASLIIIGDLVSVINTFLGGEITARFILKALSVLLVAGMVFGYYLDDVRKSMPSKSAKYFAWTTSTIVLIVIVGAFFIIGSPAGARLAQFDQQKISDLQNIQYQVVNYWQRKEKLPEKLTDLQDSISGFVVPADSQTGISFEYNIKNYEALTFELCAVFNKQGEDSNRYYETVPYPDPASVKSQYNWSHQAGRVCFERIIDKEFYPPLNKATK